MAAMRKELGWFVGDQQPAIVVDVTKRIPEPLTRREDAWAVVKDGPVTGELARDEGKAPKGTRLEGHLWTTGDRIYGRYRRAHLPGGRIVPICVELISGGDLGLDKHEGSKPGAAVGSKEANGRAVERWH
jgi:serine/threonine-protein kinase